MQIKNTILSQSDLKLLEDTILNFGRIVTFDQLSGLFKATERGAMRIKVALLVKKGWLIRIKKGQYIVITDISTLGSNDLSEYVIAKALHKGSYVSFENALQYHGLFDQMLSTVGSVTTTYARGHIVQKATYSFSRIKKELYFILWVKYQDDCISLLSQKCVHLAKNLTVFLILGHCFEQSKSDF